MFRMPRKLEEPGPDRRRNDALCAHTGDSGAVPAPLRGMTMTNEPDGLLNGLAMRWSAIARPSHSTT